MKQHRFTTNARCRAISVATLVVLAGAVAACSADRPTAPAAPAWTHGSASVIGSPTSWVYDASLGTLPEAQGFVANVGSTNPPPTVSGGVLFSTASSEGQYWNRFVSGLDFTQDFVLQTELKIISSNYIPSSP